jgi:hypothetical protein
MIKEKRKKERKKEEISISRQGLEYIRRSYFKISKILIFTFYFLVKLRYLNSVQA